MTNIKGILIVIIGLFLFITAISLFIPSRIVTVRAVTINAPQPTILNELSDLHNWKHWQPVFMQDSATIIIDATGKHAQWQNNSISVTQHTESSVKFLLGNDGDNDVENQFAILPVAESQSGRQVQWTSVTHLKWYPWQKFRGIFIEKLIGAGYETALNNLKAYLEK